MGVWQFVASYKGRDNHPTSPSALPVYKIKSDASFNSQSIWRNNTFKYFGSQTRMGKRQTVIGHTVNPDDIPPIQFFDTKIEDVTLEGLATLMDVNPKWGNVKDCGIGFPCTAP